MGEPAAAADSVKVSFPDSHPAAEHDSRDRALHHTPSRILHHPKAPKKVHPTAKGWCNIRGAEAWLKVLMGCSLFCLVWIAVTTFSPKPVGLLEGGSKICPRETVCAENWYSIALLAVSRSTAYFNYPLMMILFLSKTNNLRTMLMRTPVSLFVPLYDLHEMHVFAGKLVCAAMSVHGVCHTIRWAINGDARLLYASQTGRSGVIALLCTPLIALPMWLPRLKKYVSWEWRKGLHYLSVAWGVGILWHAPAMHIAWLMGVPVVAYLADWLYGSLGRTYLIERSRFERLENGVELSFAHPPGYRTDGTGYVMVCVPWVSPYQWHAFSVFPHPSEPETSCVCMCVTGGWTRALHEAVQRPTTRPVWVAGPYASPYATALHYDNIVLVASGVGITPAMSIIAAHKETKRTNLIWVCRDPSLLEFYLRNVHFDEHAWTLIFYTGKRKLAVEAFELPKTVFILSGRPDLRRMVMEIVSSIENGVGLPESVTQEANVQKEQIRALARELRLDSARSAIDKFSVLLKRCVCTFSADDIQAFIRDGAGAVDLQVILDTLMPEAFGAEEVAELVRHFDKDGNGVVSMGELREACMRIIGEMLLEGAYGKHGEGAAEEKLRRAEEGAMAHPRSAEDLVKLGQGVSVTLGGRRQRDLAQQRFNSKPGGDAPETMNVDPGAYKHWQMLYCGGAQPVVKALRAIAAETGIDLKEEKFDW
mmetsp:Transcript_27804/g.94895  ORF Transcript_27804/g.94895 Transcript_27804/m.94895 type:complete len:706 (+) Transcript_27804:156-2273(+)